jgi:RNA polymerase-associated protein RTF1
MEIVNAGLTLPTKAFLINKIRDIERIIQHRLTDAEIQEKLRRSGVLERKKNAIERTQLQVERKDAEYRKDEAALARIDAALAALEGPRLAFGTSLYKAVEAPKGKSQQERLAEINKANRKANTRDVRKAQIAERKRNAELQAAVERGEAVPDAFARVKVRAKTHHDVNSHLNVPKPKGSQELLSGSEASRGNTPAPGSGINTPKKESTPALGQNLEIPKVAPTTLAAGKGMVFKPSQCIENDVLASMDFGIDIDVL